MDQPPPLPARTLSGSDDGLPFTLSLKRNSPEACRVKAQRIGLVVDPADAIEIEDFRGRVEAPAFQQRHDFRHVLADLTSQRRAVFHVSLFSWLFLLPPSRRPSCGRRNFRPASCRRPNRRFGPGLLLNAVTMQGGVLSPVADALRATCVVACPG